MNQELPKRKSILLEHFNYSLPGSYFITICTDNRKNLFWSGTLDENVFTVDVVGANFVRPKNLPLSSIGKTIMCELERWNLTYENVSVDAYTIMPDHLHVLISISEGKNGRTQFAPTVSRMVKQFKGAVTKAVGFSVWQKSFMDHIIRDEDDYNLRLKYISENPLRLNASE